MIPHYIIFSFFWISSSPSLLLCACSSTLVPYSSTDCAPPCSVIYYCPRLPPCMSATAHVCCPSLSHLANPIDRHSPSLLHPLSSPLLSITSVISYSSSPLPSPPLTWYARMDWTCIGQVPKTVIHDFGMFVYLLLLFSNCDYSIISLFPIHQSCKDYLLVTCVALVLGQSDNIGYYL